MMKSKLIQAMIRYEADCPQRVQHFLKVYAFAQAIGKLEGLDERTQLTLELAAIVHDVGIRPSMEKYGSAPGPKQEEEGPPIARAMLQELGCAAEVMERVCHLVSVHHTYKDVDGLDHRILLEADYLVNAFERPDAPEAIRNACDSFFETQTGREFCREMYLQ